MGARVADEEQQWRDRFSKNLREIMKERGWTQMALAYEINTDTGVFSNYVLGKTTPSAHRLFQLAKALNVTPNRLGGWYDET